MDDLVTAAASNQLPMIVPIIHNVGQEEEYRCDHLIHHRIPLYHGTGRRERNEGKEGEAGEERKKEEEETRENMK